MASSEFMASVNGKTVMVTANVVINVDRDSFTFAERAGATTFTKNYGFPHFLVLPRV